MPLLQVRDLEITIAARSGEAIKPVRNVSFAISRGKTLALVGESGCGKSMTCLAVAGLLPRRARVSAGSVCLEGEELAGLDRRSFRLIRRRKIAFIFQDATNGLNPVKPIGWQIAEAVRLREGASWKAARSRALDLLRRVGMPDAERRMREFPHQLSGGMNQRAMIALAIAGGPRLLIADEATTALDVTIQAQIMELIADLQKEIGMAVLLVTHDLGLVAEYADHVAVMYAGSVVERAGVEALFSAPRHPYARGLLDALPRIDRVSRKLAVIEGQVPPINAMPPGCAFEPRCGKALPRCRAEAPAMRGGEHAFSCFNASPQGAPA